VSAWAEATATSEKEATNRARAIREAGLLSRYAKSLSDREICHFIIAALGSETHLEAPRRAVEFYEFQEVECVTIATAGAHTVSPIMVRGITATLGETIKNLLAMERHEVGPHVIELAMSPTHREAIVTVQDGQKRQAATFRDPQLMLGEEMPRGLKITRSIDGQAFRTIAALGKAEPHPAVKDSADPVPAGPTCLTTLPSDDDDKTDPSPRNGPGRRFKVTGRAAVSQRPIAHGAGRHRSPLQPHAGPPWPSSDSPPQSSG
jgi:hypothetical protein